MYKRLKSKLLAAALTLALIPSTFTCTALAAEVTDPPLVKATGYQDFPAYYEDSHHLPNQVTHPDVVVRDEAWNGYRYKQLIRLANVPTLRWIAALDKQDERLEKIHFGAVPEVIAPVAAGVADDDIAEKLRHQLLSVDLGQAVPRIRRRGCDQIEHAHGVTLIAQIGACFFV